MQGLMVFRESPPCHGAQSLSAELLQCQLYWCPNILSVWPAAASAPAPIAIPKLTARHPWHNAVVQPQVQQFPWRLRLRVPRKHMVVAARNIRMVCTGCSGSANIWCTCLQVRNVGECWRGLFLQRGQDVHHDGTVIRPLLHEQSNFRTAQHCLD